MSRLSERLAALPSTQRSVLEWFDARRGELIGKPPTVNGIHIFNPQTGIPKPAGWIHAVSIRQTLSSTYDDHAPVRASDGSWTYQYFQERTDPAKAARMATNKALLDCLRDDVPVGVMIQEQSKSPVRYRVWGLAKVVDFRNHHFSLQGYNDAGELPFEGVSSEITYEAGFAPYAAASELSTPMGPEDARKRIEAQIYVRQGGGKFRNAALKRFNGRCVVSQCNVKQVLEAAHIVPYRGQHTNVADNALLMRGDIHTLFDRDLLTINAETLKIHLHKDLQSSPYSEFEGMNLEIPEEVSRTILRDRLIERLAMISLK